MLCMLHSNNFNKFKYCFDDPRIFVSGNVWIVSCSFNIRNKVIIKIYREKWFFSIIRIWNVCDITRATSGNITILPITKQHLPISSPYNCSHFKQIITIWAQIAWYEFKSNDYLSFSSFYMLVASMFWKTYCKLAKAMF